MVLHRLVEGQVTELRHYEPLGVGEYQSLSPISFDITLRYREWPATEVLLRITSYDAWDTCWAERGGFGVI